MEMTVDEPLPTGKATVKTGRRPNPTIDGPRDKTVCFMLSEGEKLGVDRLAFCVHLTRSGLLSRIVTEFVAATAGGTPGREAEKKLLAYLGECREAVHKRGKQAEEFVTVEGPKA